MYDSEVMQFILSDLQNPQYTQDCTIQKLHEYLSMKVSFGQTKLEKDMTVILNNVVSGPSAIFVDGFDEAIIVDLRKYPTRGISEPENEKVMRGAKDGFVETLLFNANLIRRRIRNYNLTFEMKTVGTDSKTDVAIAYVEDIVNKDLLNEVNEKIDKVKVNSLTLGQKSLEELIIKKRWFNPMPSVQVTERPDVACSYLMEGNVIVIVDNTPSVMILPGNIFQFLQSPEDYYKNPLTGNLFRFLRTICLLISLYLLPLFVTIAGHMPDISSQINLISEGEIGPLKLLFFVIFVEFGLDLLQYTSSHTLGTLITPLSIVGGLVLSDIAINLEWFSEEVIFYAAITLLSTFMITSHEFCDALRIYRILLVICAGFFGIWGLLGGTVLVVASLVTTPTFAGKSYFWPLFPFDWRELRTLMFRITTQTAQPESKRHNRKNQYE